MSQYYMSKSDDDDIRIVRFKTFESDTEVHLIPSEDIIKHTPDTKCECQPLLQKDLDGLEDTEFFDKDIYLHQDAELRVYH